MAFPKYIDVRDTNLNDDRGGLGQRIFTTAGQGYEKQRYVKETYYAELEAELAEANKKATQRGARMQILKAAMDKYFTSDMPTPYQMFLRDYPEAEGWWKDDGTPK